MSAQGGKVSYPLHWVFKGTRLQTPALALAIHAERAGV